MADWVILMCRAFWKCLLSTSRMARAKPHKKKSDVMRMNGTRYFLSLTEWFSVSWFNIFYSISFLLNTFLFLMPAVPGAYSCGCRTAPSCFLPSIRILSGRSKRTWRTYCVSSTAGIASNISLFTKPPSPVFVSTVK